MAKRLVGPICPGCGKAPYDIMRMEKQEKGPDLKKTVWFCPSVVCNPFAKVMSDSEVWPESS